MKRALLISVAVACVLLLAVLLLKPQDPTRDQTWSAPATTFSPGEHGAKALYLLLQATHAEVTRLRHPDYSSVNPIAVLWLLGDTTLSHAEHQEISSNLSAGGTIVLLPNTAQQLFEKFHLGTIEEIPGNKTKWVVTLKGKAPKIDAALRGQTIKSKTKPDRVWLATDQGSPVIARWSVGGGHLVFLGIPSLVENSVIGKKDHGVFVTKWAHDMSTKHVFDEVQTGYADASIWTMIDRGPYRWPFVQAALVGLLALWAFGLRRYPIIAMPRVRRRQSLDHIHAVAALWSRSRDAGLPLSAILHSYAEEARRRLGGVSNANPFVAWIGTLRPDLKKQAETIWRNAETLSKKPRPRPEDVRKELLALRHLIKQTQPW